ncbi:MAG: ABC transporter permease [Rhodospirillales bacterium]|nr:ABC transporter permease [Rhodospirillales bacterium]
MNVASVVGGTPTDLAATPPTVSVEPTEDGALCLRFAGDWILRQRLPDVQDVTGAIDAGATGQRVTIDASGLGRWDSGFLTFLLPVHEAAKAKGLDVDMAGLPDGVRRLLCLATAVPERGGRRTPDRLPFLARVGMGWAAVAAAIGDAVSFIGEFFLSMGRLLRGRAQLRGGDVLLLIQQAGAQALPIVALISILVGLILAFVGSVQLQMFGAQIYVANLVAIGMTREMGAMMAAIIMAGRTGAAYAAQLGTMQVNEEIDALKTLGIDPIDFLVLPRAVALILMMPLLCVYAILLGIFGGFLVGVLMLDITPQQYWSQTIAWLRLNDFLIGVSKSVIFGIIIAVSGCLRGIQSGRSAASVGEAATAAVVTGIIWIVVADGLFAVLTNFIGI